MVIIYFSGTGNTQFIAKKFGKIMNCKAFSIEENLDFEQIILSNKTIALCYPIHFSKAPIIYMDFIKKHKKSFEGKKIISLCTQQFYSGDGARSITDLLEDVEVIYAEHFNMQNNITSLPLYYKLTKINNKKCLRKTYKKLEVIAKNIENDVVKLKGFNEFSKKLGKQQHISPESICEKQKKAIRIRNTCIKCSRCIKCCPTENLYLEGNSVAYKDKCTFCMRCANICPKQSISVLLHGDVKEQYYIMK